MDADGSLICTKPYLVDADGYATVMFTKPLSSGKVCYKFGLSDTYTDLGLLFEVYKVNAIKPSAFVSEIPEDVTFSGVGITIRDKFAFVAHGADCSTASPSNTYDLRSSTVDVVGKEVTLHRRK